MIQNESRFSYPHFKWVLEPVFVSVTIASQVLGIKWLYAVIGNGLSVIGLDTSIRWGNGGICCIKVLGYKIF